jgi:hypothetical protein
MGQLGNHLQFQGQNIFVEVKTVEWHEYSPVAMCVSCGHSLLHSLRMLPNQSTVLCRSHQQAWR